MFYFYPTGEGLTGVSFDKLPDSQHSPEVVYEKTEKQTHLKSVSCYKAMVIARMLRVHFQILAPDGYEVYVVMMILKDWAYY